MGVRGHAHALDLLDDQPVASTWTANGRRYEGFQTDILADQLVKFIQATPEDEPFFAMYSPTTPHMPSDDPRYDSMTITPPRDPVVRRRHRGVTARRSTPAGRHSPRRDREADCRYTKMAHGVRSLDEPSGPS